MKFERINSYENLFQDDSTILRIYDLVVKFHVGKKVVHAVNGVNLSLKKGVAIGIVGESGCGKSVMAHSILRLLPKNSFCPSGKIEYLKENNEWVNISSLDVNGKEMRKLRGKDISIVFQDPLSSLNPVYSIGSQIFENIKFHERKLTKPQIKERVIKLLENLGIPNAEERYNDYPHMFSGGMKQRVMIAIAIACFPNVLIADEPTTALDVTIQAQILELIKNIQKKYNTAVMLITHNMGIVAETCEEVAVMYMGRVCEFGTVKQVFENPLHPYTKGLLKSVPVLDIPSDCELYSIPGNTPDPSIEITGCEFAQRCQFATERCKVESPPDLIDEDGHRVRCWLYL